MRLRDLWPEREKGPGQESVSATPGERLPRVREAGDRLLAAGNEAISRALSGDSERFLQANQQQGGQ